MLENATINSIMSYIFYRSINMNICQGLIAVARIYIYKNETFLWKPREV